MNDTPVLPPPEIIGHSASQLKVSWSKSPSIGKLVEALARAQLKFDAVLKESVNPAFKSKYADLAKVISATQPHLAAEGLAIIQMPHAELGMHDTKLLTLTTMLAHTSGEFLTSDLTLPAVMRERFDAQSVGSAITYARRYSWAAMTGVAQEDDDGNKATGAESNGHSKELQKARDPETGNENVIFTPYKEGYTALSGPGVAIVRSSLKPEQLAQFALRAEGNVWMVPNSQAFSFADACGDLKVGTIFEDVMATKKPEQTLETKLQKSVESAENGKPFKTIASTKPRSGTRKNQKGEQITWELLEVVYGGERHVCWDKKLWPLLVTSVNKPALLSTTPSFDGKKDPSIEGIISINGVEYEEQGEKLVAKA